MKEMTPQCACYQLHPDRIERAEKQIPQEREMIALAELYKVFGDSTRVRILYAICETELCVCDIAEVLGMSLSAISHQLRILKQAHLVRYRREGKTVYYALADGHVQSILGQGLEHVRE